MSRRRQAQVRAFQDLRGFRLEYKPRRLLAAVGRALARHARRSFRNGRTAKGRLLPLGRDGRKAFRDSGSLIKSIKSKVRKRRGIDEAVVAARGPRADVGAKLRGSQAALLAVLTSGWGGRPKVDALGLSDDEIDDIAEQEIVKQLEKDVRAGRARVVSEGRGGIDESVARRLLRARRGRR